MVNSKEGVRRAVWGAAQNTLLHVNNAFVSPPMLLLDTKKVVIFLELFFCQ